ncbi:DUF2637 domain-containing protein, partial [Streptomyces sp. NPDC002835]
MPLRLAKFGVPLADTAPAGLAAAGIEPVLLPPAPVAQSPAQPELTRTAELPAGAERVREHGTRAAAPGEPAVEQARADAEVRSGDHSRALGQMPEQADPALSQSPWFTASQAAQEAYQGSYNPTFVEGFEPVPVPVPAGPGGRTRPLGPGPEPQVYEQYADDYQAQDRPRVPDEPQPSPHSATEDAEFAEAAYPVFTEYVDEYQDYPSADRLDILLADRHGLRHPRSAALLRQLLPGFQKRHQTELEAEHIA